MRLADLEARVQEALRFPLPGARAQLLLAPRPRRGWQPGVVPPGCRPGAGLLLLYPRGVESVLLLTKRDGGLPYHAGQVSLPGGAVERGETIEQGALREAREEVALDSALVRVLGRLSPLHIPVSRFVLHPVVAVADRPPVLVPRPGEVERILEVGVTVLADPGHYSVEQRSFRGTEFSVPFLGVAGEKVWGATAMVLAELLAILGCAPDPWSFSVIDR